MMACGSARPEAVEQARPAAELAVIPAENDVFPRAARVVSKLLVDADVRADQGRMVKRIAKVPLDVVQLSVECVEPIPACYQAIGRSMAANRLLFARIDGARGGVKVVVTLYDVDAKATMRSVEKVFASEDEAATGAAALVAEVVR